MARAVRSRRTDELLDDWEMLLESLVELLDRRPARGRAPIGELAGKRIHEGLQASCGWAARSSPRARAEAYHELRKKGKELRYLLELFGVQLL